MSTRGSGLLHPSRLLQWRYFFSWYFFFIGFLHMETYWFSFDSGCIVLQHGSPARGSLALVALCNFIPTLMHCLIGHITPCSSARFSALTFFSSSNNVFITNHNVCGGSWFFLMLTKFIGLGLSLRHLHPYF